MPVAFLCTIISGCSHEPEEEPISEPISEVEREIYTQESVDSMFSEDNLEAAREQLEEQGGSDYVVPHQYTAIGENQSDIKELEESNILDGKDSSFEKYDNLGNIRLDTLEIDSTFEEQDEYTKILLTDLGMGDSYYAEHYPLLWTAGTHAGTPIEEHDDGSASFYLEKYSVLVECYFKGIDSEVKEKIIRNIQHAHNNDIPIIVYGKYEQYLDEEGFPSYRLVAHQIGFKEIVN
ncbi:hypothetical protein MHB42_07945 [Lysinibacillus sp. FSL K6-0232]|uniref:hypothetical protein n=1 Tax=Lysinibacillus sp. FSL K6-0232 TaxID=2921425 RepID=UPI0030F525B9